MKAPIKTLALILFLPLLCSRLFAQNPNYIRSEERRVGKEC